MRSARGNVAWITVHALLAACSLLIIGTIALRIRSHFATDVMSIFLRAQVADIYRDVSATDARHETRLTSGNGMIIYNRNMSVVYRSQILRLHSSDAPIQLHHYGPSVQRSPGDGPRWFRLLGVTYGARGSVFWIQWHWLYFLIPQIGVFILLLLARHKLLLPKRRQHMGLCPACGYDVRATPDKCSECGKNLPPMGHR